MLNRTYFLWHVQATIDVFFGRAEAVESVDASMTGFWRSFQLLPIGLLPYIVIAIGEYAWLDETMNAAEQAASQTDFFISRLLSFVLEWLLFPLLLIPLARWLTLTQSYVRYVVVRNWSNVPLLTIYAALSLLYLAGFFGETVFLVLSLVSFGLGLRLRWLALRWALQSDVTTSVMLILADVTLSFALAAWIDGLFAIR